MNYKELMQFASERQIESDNATLELLNMSHEVSVLARFQSVCEFNLFWAYSLSPEVAIHLNSVKVLLTGIEKIKRKITLKEMFDFDFIIQAFSPESFDEFTKLVKK